VKRFWKQADVIEADGGFSVALDGKWLKTPGRADLKVPTKALAAAIAAEWQDCGENIDPRQMPLTGLANAAIERVGADRRTFAEGLARYAEADLFCYRADGPPTLVARQAESWDALLGWARRRYEVDFAI
jgi:chaperone required for assembly of F1-ATPase